MIARLARLLPSKNSTAIAASIHGLLREAYAEVPFVRKRMESAGLLPSQVKGLEDLRLLPVGSRDAMVRASREAYVHREANLATCHAAETSGTTGQPLTIYMSRGEALFRRLLLYRAMRHYDGVALPLSIAEVGAGQVHVRQRHPDILQRLGLARVTKIPRTLSPDAQARQVLAARPRIITGHPSCLEIAAEALVGVRGNSTWRPRLVVARGEVLLRSTRQTLRDVFGCQVVDLYNSEEAGNIAWECPLAPNVMHINTDGCVVEIVDDGGQPVQTETEGRVIITNLFNWTMPFIRYDLGDRAALLSSRKCVCGFEGPSMSLIEGRTGDFILLASGKRISPRTVASLMAEAAQLPDDPTAFQIRWYRVSQSLDGRLVVRYVPTKDGPLDLEESITRVLGQLDPQVVICTERLDEIPGGSPAKHRLVRVESQDRDLHTEIRL